MTTVPARTPQGARTITVVNANLFQVAEEYLGNATAWGRIADINSVPGVAPDFILTGPTTLILPRSGSGSDDGTTGVAPETILFGVNP
jgi:hypothetical protein